MKRVNEQQDLYIIL